MASPLVCHELFHARRCHDAVAICVKQTFGGNESIRFIAALGLSTMRAMPSGSATIAVEATTVALWKTEVSDL